jgi:hypothetical protein
MHSPLATALCALAFFLGCAHRGPPPAPAPGVRLAVDVGERGEVTFLVPGGWKATSGEPEPPLPRSVRFEPPLGHVVLVVTPLWGPGEASEQLEPDVARVLVEAARDRARQGAVEREVPLMPLEAPGLRGWYFSVTDRELVESMGAAGPDDYRCLLQGAVVAGPLVIAFSLLDDGDGPHREPALSLLRGAEHRPAAAQRPAGRPSEPAGRSHADPSSWGLRDVEPLELSLPGKAWSLLLDLAGWNVAEPMHRLDGSGVTVIGRRQEDGLILTASLVDAGGQRGVEACRARDWGRIGTLDGVGEPRLEVTSVEARAWYTVSEKAGPRGPPSRHLSSWRYRDGACIHLHLSLPEDEPGVEGRLLRALGAVRYGEAL